MIDTSALAYVVTETTDISEWKVYVASGWEVRSQIAFEAGLVTFPAASVTFERADAALCHPGHDFSIAQSKA